MNSKNYPIILSSYGFSEEPYLVFDYVHPDKHTRREVFFIRDKVFTITRLSRRFCVGRFNLLDFSSIPCPEKAQLSTKSNTCGSCFRANGFNPAFYNVSQDKISPQQQKYNEQPHNVYLAYFGPDMIKVGISHHKRTLTRWREQGARAATIIKECVNAYEARHIELSIGKGLSLPESFRRNQKRELINLPFRYAQAMKDIDVVRHRIEKQLNIQIQNTEIVDLGRYFFGDKVLDTDIKDVTDQEPLFISGKGIGMIGDILIVGQSEKQFMVSVKKFISYMIEIENGVKAHNLPAEQLSLF